MRVAIHTGLGLRSENGAGVRVNRGLKGLGRPFKISLVVGQPLLNVHKRHRANIAQFGLNRVMLVRAHIGDGKRLHLTDLERGRRRSDNRRAA